VRLTLRACRLKSGREIHSITQSSI
jgi:hypothetical protein